MLDSLTQAVFDDPTPAHWDALYASLRDNDDPLARLADCDPERFEAELIPLSAEWFGAEAQVASREVQIHQDGADYERCSLSLSFQRGHIHTLSLALRHEDDLDEAVAAAPGRNAWVRAALERVFRCSAGQLVQNVRVSARPDYSGGDVPVQWLADLLASFGPLAARSFYWGSDDGYSFVEVPSLDSLGAALPHLRSLTLQGEWADAFPNGLPFGLRHLGVITLDLEVIDQLASEELSALESLELWLYDHENDGADQPLLEDLEPILQAPLPGLRSVCFHRCEFAAQLIDLLPSAPFFAQLESLGLQHGSNTGSYVDEAAGLALLSEHYRHLASIDVTGCFDSPLLDQLRTESVGRIHGR